MTTTVSAEEMDFIRAILANPDDNAPRLIFADWLEEQDKDSFLIRYQAAYRNQDGKRALSYWRQTTNDSDPPYWIEGFIERLEVTSQWWLSHCDAVTKYHPIRHVTLRTMPEIDYIDSDLCIAYFPLYTKNAYGFDVEEMNEHYKEKHDGKMPDYVADLLLFEYWPNITFNVTYPIE